MDKMKIIDYVKASGGASIAELQKQFGATYAEVKQIIDEMLSRGALTFSGGVRYDFVKGYQSFEERMKDMEDKLDARIRRLRHEAEDEDEDEEDYDDDDDEDDPFPVEIEEEDDGEFQNVKPTISEDELRRLAVERCMRKGTASASMLQRTFPIGYVRAAKLIDWMEAKGYISERDGIKPRKVLITQEQYESDFLHIDAEDKKKELPDLDGILKLFERRDEENKQQLRERHTRLITALARIIEKKSSPITADVVPEHLSWSSEADFRDIVMNRIERLIKTDRKMGLKGAIKKAEIYLEAVRDTHDRRMVQVYERMVYELKNTNGYIYGRLKRQCFNE